MNRDSIREIVRTYLPEAREDLIQTLVDKAEREMESAGREVVRKLVLKEIALNSMGGSLIDTRA